MKQKPLCRLRIDTQSDRRKIVAIVADHGYKAKIVDEKDNLHQHKYFVEIYSS